jgi:hypothetical protein|tara:strand:- start:527 stop:1660 length:1134 start_codon:yes stop_codon:yes gene_type:complete
MNIAHPLLRKIDINSISNIDVAFRKIEELGLKCKIYNDTIIVKYPKSLKHANEDFILKSRGIIIDFTNKKIINQSIDGCMSYDDFIKAHGDNWNNIVIEKCLDGILFNVYYHANKWCISTKFCVDADESKFKNNRTYRQLFDEVMPDCTQHLDKSYTYSFLLQHCGARNVSIITRNRLFHLESTNNITGDKVQITIPEIDSVEILKYGTHINKLGVNSYKELEDIVASWNWSVPGVMLYTADRRHRAKLPNCNFKRVHDIVANQPNLKYLIVDSIYKKANLPALLKYFPEYSALSVEVNNAFSTFAINTHKFYITCKIKSIYIDLPKQYKKIICDLHNIYKSQRSLGNKHYKITYATVCDTIRSYDTSYLYSILFPK